MRLQVSLFLLGRIFSTGKERKKGNFGNKRVGSMQRKKKRKPL